MTRGREVWKLETQKSWDSPLLLQSQSLVEPDQKVEKVGIHASLLGVQH